MSEIASLGDRGVSIGPIKDLFERLFNTAPNDKHISRAGHNLAAYGQTPSDIWVVGEIARQTWG